MQEYITNFYLQAFPTFDLVSIILPNLRTPLWGFWHPFWQLFYNIDSRCCNKKVPLSQMHLDFYMPFSSIAQTPVFFIIRQHQPLIFILTSNYSTILLSHWCSKIHQWPAQQFEQEENILERTCHLAPPFSLLSYLPSSITQTFLQCSRSVHHPSLGATHVLHNTQTNKVAYPCIPCSNDGHIMHSL
jgi:hypothetical protein